MTIIFNKSLKSLIIQTLASRFPLQVHELKKIMTKDYKRRFTTQGLHKALNVLMTDQVVNKRKHAYFLSTKYIVELDRFVGGLRQTYFNRGLSIFPVQPGEEITLFAGSITALDKIWNAVLREKIGELSLRNQVFAQYFPHAWFNLVHMGEELKIVNVLVQECKGFYTLVNGSTALDEWMGRFYSDKNMFYHMREETDNKEKTLCYGVLGPYVLETHYPRSLANALDLLFSASHDLQSLDLNELIAIVNTPMKLVLTVSHNERKAAKLRQKILSYF